MRLIEFLLLKELVLSSASAFVKFMDSVSIIGSWMISKSGLLSE